MAKPTPAEARYLAAKAAMEKANDALEVYGRPARGYWTPDELAADPGLRAALEAASLARQEDALARQDLWSATVASTP